MYIWTKLFQITLLLFVSLTLAVISWVPSLLVENIVNFTRVGLFIIAGYLVYLIIKRLHDAQKKRNVYISTGYTLILLSYLGLFAILQIGVSLTKSTYVETYKFGHHTFYIYKTNDGSSEISIKDKYLPIRSVPIASSFYMPIVLEKQKRYLYAIGEGINIKVYDFTTDSTMENIKTKEKND